MRTEALPMNYIDIILILVGLSSILACIKRGFIISTLELLSWVGSLMLAFLVNRPLSDGMEKIIPALGVWASPLSFIVTTIIFKLFLDQASNWVIFNLPEKIHKNVINRLLGILPGIINGLLWAGFIGAFLLLLPFSNLLTKHVQESRLANRLMAEVGWLGQKFSAVFSNALNQSGPDVSLKVGAEEPIKLPFTVKNPNVRPDLEADMLLLVNKERLLQGLHALKLDSEMTGVARKHSVDMFKRGYFSHITPEGASPFDRMARERVTFVIAGENLALAQRLSIAHNGLMKSPGHRANILNPAFGRIGIAVLDGGIYGLMITQNFRN
ncbi:MAG: hypothetical protein JWQ28_3170 [Pedobacter sp.]|nr:hypothetical protein [Pedobacter sp.]